jgi:hypothetical protein
MASAKKSVKPAKAGKTTVKKPPPAKVKGKRQADVADADPTLFDPLTPGETADALRTLTEDRRLSQVAKIGRFRVICTEPLVVKPPHWMAGHRLARVVAYDYASDRTIDARSSRSATCRCRPSTTGDAPRRTSPMRAARPPWCSGVPTATRRSSRSSICSTTR